MAFPATVPAENTRTVQDGVTYIAKSGRWEKLSIPGGVTGGTFVNRTWTAIDWSGLQSRPLNMISIKAAMTPKVDTDIDVGFLGASINKYIPSSYYEAAHSAGLVNWGTSGTERLDWNVPTAFRSDSFWLANPEPNTRHSAANRPQVLTMKLLKISDTKTMISWEFFQVVSDTPHPLVMNTCKMQLNWGMGDITGMFFRCITGEFASGRTTVEVY